MLNPCLGYCGKSKIPFFFLQSILCLPVQVFCFLQVYDLQEEENRVRQLSGERGVEGDHLLLPPNDRGQQSQLGHLREDSGSVWENEVRQIECSQIPSCLICSLGRKGSSCTSKFGLCWQPWSSRRAETLQCLELWHTVCLWEDWFLCCKRPTVQVWAENWMSVRYLITKV